MQGLPRFFSYPLSQERVKLQTSNFVLTFLISIGTKAHYKFREKQPFASQNSRNFSGRPYIERIARSSLRQLSFLVFVHGKRDRRCCGVMSQNNQSPNSGLRRRIARTLNREISRQSFSDQQKQTLRSFSSVNYSPTHSIAFIRWLGEQKHR